MKYSKLMGLAALYAACGVTGEVTPNHQGSSSSGLEASVGGNYNVGGFGGMGMSSSSSGKGGNDCDDDKKKKWNDEDDDCDDDEDD